MRFLALLLFVATSFAETTFVTGQGARLVVGQSTFTSQEPGASAKLVGAISGVAYANDTLFVTDSNRVNASPINHRALIYRNVSDEFPGPLEEIPVVYERCLVCVGEADVVLGQQNLTDHDLKPTAADSLRVPCGISSDGVRLAIADTDNNRVLIWNSIPNFNGRPADVVLGQADMKSAVSNGFNPTAKSLKGPQGVWLHGGRLFVADTGNNRVLIWNQIPTTNQAVPDIVLGQRTFDSFVQPDLTKAELKPTAETLYTPVSVTTDGRRLYVADLSHNRVLIWNSIPTQNSAPADLVLGQHDFESANPNDSRNLCKPIGADDEGVDIYPRRCAATLEFPRFALSDGNRLFIADGGNDRILVYDQLPAANGAPADHILGQVNDEVNNVSDSAFPDDIASAGAIRTPSALAWDGANLYASDPFNRRLLVFTLAERLVANTGVRNGASFDVYAVGRITLEGEAAKDDEITVTIEEEREYKYKVLEGQKLPEIATALAEVINAGNGDPDVIASPNPEFFSVILTAKVPGMPGNEITYAATVSDTSKVIVTTASGSLNGGGEPSKIAPGTIVSIVGENLSEESAAADPQATELPRDLAGVQVYIDGIRAPLYFVSPSQINAQMPVEVYDAQSANAYVRTQRRDGSVVATNVIAVPVIQYNPGIFTQTGEVYPLPAVAFHISSNAVGVVSVDGQAKAGDIATVIIGEDNEEQGKTARRYSYTVKAEDVPPEGEQNRVGLEKIRDGLIALINEDPEVKASAAGIFATRIRLEARVAGPEGNGIKYSTETTGASGDAVVILTATTEALCCANEAGAPVTTDNPAIAGEVITVYATGLGLVQPDVARWAQRTGLAYDGPELNEPVEFVSSLAGDRTANVLASGLMPGTVGVYRVDLQLNSGLPTNPATGVTIAQGFQVSNVATIPVFNPNPEEPEEP